MLDADYENVTTRCRSCGELNVFNRATDIGDCGFAIGRIVPCLSCGEPVRINFETADPAYKTFISESYLFRHRKRYMLAVTTLTQAFEMFFALCAEAILVCHVENHDPRATKDDVLMLADHLYRETKRETYHRMRNLLVHLAIGNVRPTTVSDSLREIRSIPRYLSTPSSKLVATIPDAELRTLLQRLLKLPLGELRNKVAHKYAYRPTLPEVNECLDRALDLLGDIWIKLDLTASMCPPVSDGA